MSVLVFMLVLLSPGSFAAAQEESDALTVFLVRHAEKVDESLDPELSAEGHQRADDLAATLRDAGIEHVRSSDYTRTRDTAAPIAEMLGLDVEIYNVHDLPKLVETLRAAGGRHLVVGHSNTTPKVVSLLGGEPGTAIDEDAEYDRLYMVSVGAGGEVSTVLLRYGAVYNSEPAERGAATRTANEAGRTDG